MNRYEEKKSSRQIDSSGPHKYNLLFCDIVLTVCEGILQTGLKMNILYCSLNKQLSDKEVACDESMSAAGARA